MFVFVVVVCVDVMYEMLCTNNKCINIEYYYNFISLIESGEIQTIYRNLFYIYWLVLNKLLFICMYVCMFVCPFVCL